MPGPEAHGDQDETTAESSQYPRSSETTAEPGHAREAEFCRMHKKKHFRLVPKNKILSCANPGAMHPVHRQSRGSMYPRPPPAS